MVKVAVDAMGGDHAPDAIVRGAELAVREGIAAVVLVGDEHRIRPLLSAGVDIEVVHAPTVVEMSESPSIVLRKKRDSSVNVALSLVKKGEAQAVVSAGNSGATMAFAIFTLGRIPGVDRPAILTFHRNVKGGVSILLDAGGTVDCKPVNLVQFGVMGSVFAHHVLGIDEPRVGVLSNGQEETKGNELTREANALLKTVNINYIGYIEGTNLYDGSVHVVVSDGFVGNVALKVAEGVAEAITGFIKERIMRKARRKLGFLLLKDVFKELAKMTDYSEYGGGPLLGVEGTCIICHGKSNEIAIKNAIRLARDLVGHDIDEHLRDALQGFATQLKGKES
jgi:glycerol-3-phosphate acyltransferase PlsX